MTASETAETLRKMIGCFKPECSEGDICSTCGCYVEDDDVIKALETAIELIGKGAENDTK